GEMVTLGHELGADDQVEAASGDVVELLAQALKRVDQITRQHQDAAPGKQLGRLLLQPLDAGTDRDERLSRLALRALRRRRHGEAAMVTDQPPAEAVIDQPGIAIGTGEADAAGATQRQRRVAAAIEKEQRLPAALDRAPHPLGWPRRGAASAARPLESRVCPRAT